MKPKNPDMLDCRLKPCELKLLCGYYEVAIEEASKCGSELLQIQREENTERLDDLKRMFDGRWKNKGKGRPRSKETATAPSLPLENPKPDKENRPF